MSGMTPGSIAPSIYELMPARQAATNAALGLTGRFDCGLFRRIFRVAVDLSFSRPQLPVLGRR